MNPILNLLIFILWPFGGVVISIFNKRNKITNFIFLLFFFLVGCSFSFNNIEFDSYRYTLDFAQYRIYENETIFMERLLRGKIDFYDFIICSIVSKFTDSARVLFGVYALVFSFFILKSYIYIKSDIIRKNSIYIYIVLLTIFCLNPHININGVRYFTATWVFFTSFIAYFVYNNRSWIIGFCVSFIIHISFLIPVCFIFISMYFIKHYGIKHIFYITTISFIVGTFLPIDSVLSILPNDLGLFQHFKAYTNEENALKLQTMKEGRNLLYHFFSKLPFIYVFIFLFQLKNKMYELNKENYFLFTFVMLFLSFLFLIDKMPSMGRFYTISYMLLLFLIFRLYKEYPTLFIKKIILISPVIFFGRIYEVFVIHDLVLSNIYIYRHMFDIIEYALSYTLK